MMASRFCSFLTRKHCHSTLLERGEREKFLQRKNVKDTGLNKFETRGSDRDPPMLLYTLAQRHSFIPRKLIVSSLRV